MCVGWPTYGDFGKGARAFFNQDYDVAIRELEPEARNGDASAQTLMAEIYANGLGVSRNLELAFGWFKQAAAQSIENAQFEINPPCFPLPRSCRPATTDFNWIEKFAIHGLVSAQFHLGNYYSHGPKVEEPKAIYWYCRAAQKGNADAQNNLGAVYTHNATENPIDRIRAYAWYSVAMKSGQQLAKENRETSLGADYDYCLCHCFL